MCPRILTDALSGDAHSLSIGTKAVGGMLAPGMTSLHQRAFVTVFDEQGKARNAMRLRGKRRWAVAGRRLY